MGCDRRIIRSIMKTSYFMPYFKVIFHGHSLIYGIMVAQPTELTAEDLTITLIQLLPGLIQLNSITAWHTRHCTSVIGHSIHSVTEKYTL